MQYAGYRLAARGCGVPQGSAAICPRAGTNCAYICGRGGEGRACCNDASLCKICFVRARLICVVLFLPPPTGSLIRGGGTLLCINRTTCLCSNRQLCCLCVDFEWLYIYSLCIFASPQIITKNIWLHAEQEGGYDIPRHVAVHMKWPTPARRSDTPTESQQGEGTDNALHDVD